MDQSLTRLSRRKLVLGRHVSRLRDPGWFYLRLGGDFWRDRQLVYFELSLTAVAAAETG